MAGKLTKAQQEFRLDLCRITIAVAERPAGLRGPFRFDEDDLQRRATRARRILSRAGRRSIKENGR